MKWIENRIEIDTPKHPKKITGTRFGAILGVNRWKTPFEVWCEITHVYEKPFEDTKYTLAGKAIEPKQILYMKENYFMEDIQTPTDKYGSDFFQKTHGDFYPNETIFGGMWDSLRTDSGKPSAVLEFKATSRAEDWRGEIPEYYALQGALYAYLLGVDDVIMVASFLEPKDYDNPESFVCDVNNTITVPFKVSKRYPFFEENYIEPAIRWWNEHVVQGVSPEFDEKADAEILKELRTNNVDVGADLEVLISKAEELKDKIDDWNSQISVDEKLYKQVTDAIKSKLAERYRDGDTKVTVNGNRYSWTDSLVYRTEIDKDALKRDGILEKYSVQKATHTLKTGKI